MSKLYAWDAAKADANLAKHGVPFEAIDDFEVETALVFEDTRHDYGERRFVALGLIVGRLHVAIYIYRDGRRRLISLRKANAREREVYSAQA